MRKHLSIRDVYGESAGKLGAVLTGVYGCILGIFLSQTLCSLLSLGG